MNFVHLNGKVENIKEASDHHLLGYDACLAVRIDRNFLDLHGKMNDFLIPVYLWKGAKQDFASSLEPGSSIIVHGRMDQIASELVVIAEQFKVI